MDHGYRWWNRLTGVPNWMRFRSLPDWSRIDPYGFAPPARPAICRTWPALQTDYFRHTLPSAQMFTYPISWFLYPYDLYGAVHVTPEQALEYVRSQAEILEDELAALKGQIKILENDSERR